MSSRERQTGQIKLPARWPKDIRYFRSYHFHASVTPVIRDFVKGTPSIAELAELPSTYRNCVAIRPITSSIHPAYGQYGLFATSHIKPNMRILDYTGRLSLSHGCGQCHTNRARLQVNYIVMIALRLNMTSPSTDPPMA